MICLLMALVLFFIFIDSSQSIELKAGGEEEDVTIHNVEEYVERSLDWCLHRGVYRQLEALRAG